MSVCMNGKKFLEKILYTEIILAQFTSINNTGLLLPLIFWFHSKLLTGLILLQNIFLYLYVYEMLLYRL